MPGPGAGLCPGYTTSRAILADAVALTRGDRYLTTELNRTFFFNSFPVHIPRRCTAYNLTTWGYQDCQYEDEDGAYGGMLTKLLFRTLPQYYPTRSAYAHFPFLTPKSMEPHMMERDPAQAVKYMWSRPKPLGETCSIADYSSVGRILSDSSLYLSSYDAQKFTVVQRALGKPGVSDDRSLRAEEILASAIEDAKRKVISGSNSLQKVIFKPTPEIATYFAEKTRSLISSKSFGLVGGQGQIVDIVKDVINLLPVHWISHIVGVRNPP